MPRQCPSKPLIAIIGATGTGKSQLAVSIAQCFNGEVINGDAMQLYSGLRIITNKISSEEQGGVPHHLLGCIGLEEQPWVVGTFVKRALKVIEEIRGRGKVPILVGGTHYYTQSLLFEDQLAEAKDDTAEDAQFVADTSAKWPILKGPTETILSELRRVDPVMADQWHPNDRRKIQRSLEIYLQTGKKASDIYAEQKQKQYDDVVLDSTSFSVSSATSRLRFPTLLLWVHADSDSLQERLEKRVDNMIEAGLLDEVKTLDAFAESEAAAGRPVDESRGIWVSIGYKEFKSYASALRSNTSTEEEKAKLKSEAVELTKIATWQYAKRQIKWIRNKLFGALGRAGAQQQLFIFDSSLAEYFRIVVECVAIDTTQRFLSGTPLPDPTVQTAIAAHMLPTMRNSSTNQQQKIRNHCDVCDVTCVTENQWQMHVKSKAHRKLTSRRKTQENEEENQGENEAVKT